jgi:hypothetical protein
MAKTYEDNQPREGEIIALPRRPRSNEVPYDPAPAVYRPRSPEGRGRGLLGLLPDRKALAHIERKDETIRLGVEIDLACRTGLQIDIAGLKDAGEAANKLQRIVDSHDPDSLPGKLTLDMAARSVVRTRYRHEQFQEIYDAEVSNIIQRR